MVNILNGRLSMYPWNTTSISELSTTEVGGLSGSGPDRLTRREETQDPTGEKAESAVKKSNVSSRCMESKSSP
jgi:hypothetical protein